MDRSKWEYKKLGEVCTVVSGSTPKTQVEEFWNGSHYWITPAELDGSTYVSKSERLITDAAIEKTNLSLLPVGTVLLSSRAPIGKVAITTVPMYCNQGFKNLICSDTIYNKYLYWFLKVNTEYLNSLGRGATFKEISKTIVENIKIPLYSLADQQRIVAELDCLNEMIALKQEQLKEFDKLAQSIFYDMFGDIMLNDKAWPVYKWKDLFDTKLGKMLDKKKQNEEHTSLPYLANANVQWGNFDLKDLKTMTFNDKEKDVFSLRKNDLLICEGGESGRCAIWTEEKTDIKFQKAIHRARVKDKSLIIPLYAMHYMKEIKGKGGLKNYVSKATIEHLTGEKLNQVPVLLPPLALQQQFAEKIQVIEAQKELVKKSIAETQQLLDSRMDYYFD